MLDKLFGAFTFGATSGSSSGGQGSSTLSSLLEMGSIIILTILIAYIIGLMITHIVDKKLGDISIKMPQINVTAPKSETTESFSSVAPQPQLPPIVFKISEDVSGKIKLETDKSSSVTSNIDDTFKKNKEKIDHPNRVQKYEPFLSVSFDEDETIGVSEQPKTTILTVSQSQDTDVTKEVVTHIPKKIGCVKDEDCNGVFGGGANVCKSDGTCHCVSGSGTFCQLGPTNYKDPKDMTQEERQRFKWKYRSNMTLQDYKNWLYLYKDEIENLRQHHRRNLLKLLRGGQLTDRDLPAVQLKPPTDAADYFQKMYKGGKISVHFPDNDSPLIGYNYNQYTDLVSPENTASSWITGVVDLYKETKDDAKALDWHLRPETSSKFEEQTVGDIYQKYTKKQHDFSDLRKIAQVINQQNNVQVPISQRKDLVTFDDNDDITA